MEIIAWLVVVFAIYFLSVLLVDRVDAKRKKKKEIEKYKDFDYQEFNNRYFGDL